MKFKLWLEAIEYPPHMPNKFLKEYYEALKKIGALLEEVAVQEQGKGFHTWVRDFAGSNAWYKLDDQLTNLEYLWRAWSGYGDIIKSFEDYFEFSEKAKNDEQWWSLATRTLRSIIKKTDDIAEALADVKLEGLEELIKEIESETDGQKEYFDEEEYPTYNEAKKQISKFKDTVAAVSKMKNWFPSFKGQLGALVTTPGSAYSEKLPPHEKTETMYHTTIDLPSLLNQGFKTRKEIGKGALGGGPSDVISFTVDPKIAESIVWALRQAIGISQGKIDYNKLKKIVLRYGGNKVWEDTVNYAQRSWGDFETKEKGYGFSDEPARPKTDREKREWLFQAFRYFMMAQKEIYDPLFSMVGVEDFEDKNINNIGIIAADIDMDQIKEYLPSMAEFRVPVSAIKNIRRVPYGGINRPYI